MFGNMPGFFNFSSYGVKTGIIGSQINVKLSADKKGRIRPYLSLGYALFYGKDNSTAYIDSNILNIGYPLTGSRLYNTIPGSSKLYMHIFNAGAGFEYAFMNKTRWTPHLEAEADLNMIFGTYRQTPYNAGETSFTIKNAIRFGFGAGGGVQLRLTKAFGLSFTAKYKFANLLGKQSERTTEQNKMELLDKADTSINGNLGKNRHIQYIEVMLGASFYIGKK
jgi:opacity protein-like surface antigen